jgi:acetylornithine deacetylase/succinyl-diaminopimelate desuccinylase-like protein
VIIKKRSHNYFQGKPYLVEPGSPFGKAAEQALEKTFGLPVAFIREGRGISIMQSFKAVLNLNALLVGLMLTDAKAHSPDENFPLGNFEAPHAKFPSRIRINPS